MFNSEWLKPITIWTHLELLAANTAMNDKTADMTINTEETELRIANRIRLNLLIMSINIVIMIGNPYYTKQISQKLVFGLKTDNL